MKQAKTESSIASIVLMNEDNSAEIVIDTYTLRKASTVLRALMHPFRKKILIALEERGSATVTDLHIVLRTQQVTLSNHLKIMRDVNVLNTSRDGKYIYYSINKNKLEKMMLALQEFKQCL